MLHSSSKFWDLHPLINYIINISLSI